MCSLYDMVAGTISGPQAIHFGTRKLSDRRIPIGMSAYVTQRELMNLGTVWIIFKHFGSNAKPRLQFSKDIIS